MNATYSTSKFTYHKATRRFVTEASDLSPASVPMFTQIYPDSCDEGLTLVSERTDQQVKYAVNHVERDGEGDVLWWSLVPCKYQTLNNETKQTSIVIYND